jgi:hypothetical protein
MDDRTLTSPDAEGLVNRYIMAGEVLRLLGSEEATVLDGNAGPLRSVLHIGAEPCEQLDEMTRQLAQALRRVAELEGLLSRVAQVLDRVPLPIDGGSWDVFQVAQEVQRALDQAEQGPGTTHERARLRLQNPPEDDIQWAEGVPWLEAQVVGTAGQAGITQSTGVAGTHGAFLGGMLAGMGLPAAPPSPPPEPHTTGRTLPDQLRAARLAVGVADALVAALRASDAEQAAKHLMAFEQASSTYHATVGENPAGDADPGAGS